MENNYTARLLPQPKIRTISWESNIMANIFHIKIFQTCGAKILNSPECWRGGVAFRSIKFGRTAFPISDQTFVTEHEIGFIWHEVPHFVPSLK